MRFDHNSPLASINMSHLEFTCRNIAAWVEANNSVFLADNSTLPVELLGHGSFGSAWRLLDYPGLVLKICYARADDGYPDYIKAVANCKNPKRWMPRVFMYGGEQTARRDWGSDERPQNKVFWCVLPEYENPWGHASHYAYQWVGSPWPELACDQRTPDLILARQVKRLPKKERRQARQLVEFLTPFVKADYSVYMHAHNALKFGDQWVITDPIASRP